ncbi:MAG: ATP-grasp domain-containing protein [Opitutales bacterium]|nr:ATP-grasp domain-containing protein [Opitutales bacterium]
MRASRVLFSSLSGKIALFEEVVRDVKSHNSDSVVIGADCNPDCSGAAQVEHFITMPRLDKLSDKDLVQLCVENQITHVLPTRDGELNFWATRRHLLTNIGVTPWVSGESFIKSCEDKIDFCQKWKDSAIPSIPTFDKIKSSMAKSWVVKERKGSASRKIGLNLSAERAAEISKDLIDPIFQPFIEGKEFSAETWVSHINKCHGVLLRWRDKVVNGESHHTTVFRNSIWEAKLKKVFEHQSGARGHCLAQVLVDSSGGLHLIEINPRLGGASPLAFRAGLHSVKWHLLEEVNKFNQANQPPVFTSGLYLKKEDGKVSFGP